MPGAGFGPASAPVSMGGFKKIVRHLLLSWVTILSQAAKDRHCERSEAISNLGGLLRRFTSRNDK